MDHPVCYSRSSGFGRFRGGSRTGAKLEYFKIKGILRHGK
jgi:hypothetical protein